MTMRIKDVLLPITYENWDEVDAFSIIFYNVIFTEDFRDIKKDSTFPSIYIDYTTGIFEAYSNEVLRVLFTYELKLT
jgi:hypothetical protein